MLGRLSRSKVLRGLQADSGPEPWAAAPLAPEESGLADREGGAGPSGPAGPCVAQGTAVSGPGAAILLYC